MKGQNPQNFKGGYKTGAVGAFPDKAEINFKFFVHHTIPYNSFFCKNFILSMMNNCLPYPRK